MINLYHWENILTFWDRLLIISQKFRYFFYTISQLCHTRVIPCNELFSVVILHSVINFKKMLHTCLCKIINHQVSTYCYFKPMRIRVASGKRKHSQKKIKLSVFSYRSYFRQYKGIKKCEFYLNKVFMFTTFFFFFTVLFAGQASLWKCKKKR